jgi:exopolysaccharide production protein ExoQ
MTYLFHTAFWILAIWLIRRDTAQRAGISSAIWIPTLWIGILSSKPLTGWVGFGGSDGSLEGSPLDRAFYFLLIFSALFVLLKRNLDWKKITAQNSALFIFYGYLLISVLWANSPVASFKRWCKESGNILIILVIYTETNPLGAIQAVFARCAYVLIPLSILYIRYFPELGRRYSRSGFLEITGVTNQKNSLGTMVLVCGLIFIWDWIARSLHTNHNRYWIDRYIPPMIAFMGAYLIYLSDSKTSIVCLIMGIGIIIAIRYPVLHRKVSAFGVYILGSAVVFFLTDRLIGITEWIVSSLGRDMTLTGRTDVWRELLSLRTDPLIGTGFMSLWDDPHYRSILPYWVGGSAHNGYLEIYLAGGLVGAALLTMMLISSARKINHALSMGGDFAVVRFAIFVAALLANVSESNFASMTPLGFVFLLAAMGDAPKIPIKTYNIK